MFDRLPSVGGRSIVGVCLFGEKVSICRSPVALFALTPVVRPSSCQVGFRAATFFFRVCRVKAEDPFREQLKLQRRPRSYVCFHGAAQKWPDADDSVAVAKEFLFGRDIVDVCSSVQEGETE